MPTVLQFRRGNTTQNNSFTGTAGELSIDTTLDTVRVHDGSTAGGFELTQNAATQTLTNKTLTSAVLNTGVSGTAVLDEDNMASDSATQLATQQSIKAYVDSQVTAVDVDIAGDTGTGAITDAETLTFTGGTGIDTTVSGNEVSFAIDSSVTTLTGTQTLTNKTLTSPKVNEDVAVTATATEINILDGATLDTTELNYVDGVTSSIQTQLDTKATTGKAIAMALVFG